MAEVFFTVSEKDLPEKHISVITQAGYEIISFDYPLAPAADLEQIVPDICDSAWRSVPSVTCLIPKKILTDFSSIGHSSGTDTFYAVSHIFSSDLNINNNNKTDTEII